MTVSTRPYFSWGSSGLNWRASPFESCSPNLLSLLDWLRRQPGGTDYKGCHVNRDIIGGSSLSSHAFGAALDVGFPSRARTVEVMGFLIVNSKELGINAIHDYLEQRIWYPIRGWHPVQLQTGSWIHIEPTPEAFADGRPVEDKLTGGIAEVEPSPAEVAHEVWY